MGEGEREGFNKMIASGGGSRECAAAVSAHVGERAVQASSEIEIEELSLKLRDSEEKCLSLSQGYTNLLSQKNDLISQMETIHKCFINLEAANETLEEENLNLLNEKYLYVDKVQELENSLSLLQKELENKMCLISRSCVIENQEFLSLVQSSEVRLSVLESQVEFLFEEKMVIDNKLKEEEQRSMNSMVEFSIMQSYLSEMKGVNSAISHECQWLLESYRCAKEQIKQLEESDLAQNENIGFLMDHICKVRDGIHLLLSPLNINHELMNFDGSEAVIIQTILGEIYNLLAANSIFNDENQLLKQAELENILLGQEIDEADRQTLVLKAELESLNRKLKDSLEDLNISREENNTFEEENDFIWVEAMTWEHLYLFFRSLNDERTQQMKLLNGEMCSLLTIQNNLVEEIRDSKEKERYLVNENNQLGESLALLEELRTRTAVLEFDVCTDTSICEELTLQVEERDNLLKVKSMEVSNAAAMLQSKQEEVDEAKLMIAIQHSNEVELKKKLDDLENENARLRTNLMAISPLSVSLGNCISSAEENASHMAKLHGNQESPSNQLEDHETSTVDHEHSAMEGVFEMQNLITKLESLEELFLATKSHFDQEKLQPDNNLDSPRRKVEELKLKESSIRKGNQGMNSSTCSIVKDTELDQTSNSCGLSTIHSAESNDQMLNLWKSSDRDFENWFSSEHDIELVEEVKSKKPSSDRTPQVSLRDYLYGSKDEKGRKDKKRRMRNLFCWCVKPGTNED